MKKLGLSTLIAVALVAGAASTALALIGNL